MNKIRTAFIFHYRNDAGSGSLREKVFKRVDDFYRKTLIEHQWETVEFIEYTSVASDHQPYNRAASRNKAVQLAKQLNADIVVIMDSDTFIQPENVVEAIELAHTTGDLIFPFNRYRKELQFNMLNSYLHRSWPKGGYASLGTAYVVKPETWEQFGGQDEAFTGWGVEDNVTVYTAWAFGVKHQHLQQGVAFAIDTRDSRRKLEPGYAENYSVQQEYEQLWALRETEQEETARVILRQKITKRKNLQR